LNRASRCFSKTLVKCFSSSGSKMKARLLGGAFRARIRARAAVFSRTVSGSASTAGTEEE
jgi:hypothetical protein